MEAVRLRGNKPYESSQAIWMKNRDAESLRAFSIPA